MKKNRNGIIHKLILQTIGHEKRQPYMIPIFTIVLSLIFGAIIIALLGSNPFKAYYNLLQGSGLAPRPPTQDTRALSRILPAS